jgi:protein-arginine kinase activator protein McsA
METIKQLFQIKRNEIFASLAVVHILLCSKANLHRAFMKKLFFFRAVTSTVNTIKMITKKLTAVWAQERLCSSLKLCTELRAAYSELRGFRLTTCAEIDCYQRVFLHISDV